MARKHTPKKRAPKISDRVEARIVALSLQNPDFGAGRLGPLLKKKKIRVTSSQIYTILRRNGLSSREKRLAKLAEAPRSKPVRAAKKKPTGITDDVVERIVLVSLQHPDYGAQRLLPLLEKEAIRLTASAVYRVLKRNGLQNRDKRLARSQAQQAVQASPPETDELFLDPFEAPPPAEESEWIPETIEPIVPVAAEEPEPIPEVIEQNGPPPAAAPQPLPGIIEEQMSPSAEPEQLRPRVVEKRPPPYVPAVSKATEKTIIRGPWLLTIFNILLLLLLLVLGLYTWQNVRQSGLEPEITAAIPATPPNTAPVLSETAPSLSSYGIISERNLFNVSKEETAAPQKEIEVEKIALAQKDLGLKLVGTVVVDNSNRSIAIIDNRKTREQEAYHEGDQANEVLIKKVMRNKVIIVTEEGDKLLTVETKETATRSRSPSYARNTAGSPMPLPQLPPQMPAARTGSITLDRQEVESAFADSEKLLQEINVAPYMQGDQSTGIRLNRVPAKNIFRKMGLRSRDVIVGVNGESISGPEQAEDFIRTLGQGGEVTITIKRRRRTHQIRLNIE